MQLVPQAQLAPQGQLPQAAPALAGAFAPPAATPPTTNAAAMAIEESTLTIMTKLLRVLVKKME